jgi:hypothetical protein
MPTIKTNGVHLVAEFYSELMIGSSDWAAPRGASPKAACA